MLKIYNGHYFNFQMNEEIARFEHEKNERIRLMQEKQARELEEFDKESDRNGFR